MTFISGIRRAVHVMLLVVPAGVAHAHSASDAYLTLTREAASGAANRTVIHGQWDIALRDLDFVLKLDADGDGGIEWRELRARQGAIAQYALRSLQVSAGGRLCRLSPTHQLVDDHADGAYAALFFDIVCDRASQRLSLGYRLFFGVDPSHRCILVMRSGESVATAVLSPGNAKVPLFP